MKPYGREKKVKGGTWKIDHKSKYPQLFKGGKVNWWEDICDYLSRGAIKQRVKKEIDEQINEEEI